MKKTVLMISILFAFSIAITGCATKGDLEKVQANEQQLNLKADQALKASQEANENAAKAADAAKMADERARMAEERERAAQERARIAEEKADRYDASFKKSMKK